LLYNVLGLLVFVFLCVGLVVGLSDCRMSDVGLSDCFGNGFPQRLGMFWIRQGTTKAPHSPTTPARALKKIYTGRVKHKHGVWCLEREEKSMNVSVGGMLETEHGL